MSGNNNLLNIGDPIELYLGKGAVYKSKLEDVMEDGSLLVSQPTHKGIPLIPRSEQGLQLYFYKKNGRYRLNVKFLENHRIDNASFMKLEVLSDANRQQRRLSYRLSINLDVIIRSVESGTIPINPGKEDDLVQETTASINISSTGIALKTKREYNPGEKVFLRLFLEWPSEEKQSLDLVAEIKQFETLNKNEKTFFLGASFIGVTREAGKTLSRFVMACEQQQLKQKI